MKTKEFDDLFLDMFCSDVRNQFEKIEVVEELGKPVSITGDELAKKILPKDVDEAFDKIEVKLGTVNFKMNVRDVCVDLEVKGATLGIVVISSVSLGILVLKFKDVIF